jgi:uncharacterized protein YlzI (FlbEa/FlbD family)
MAQAEELSNSGKKNISEETIREITEKIIAKIRKEG